MKDNSHKADSHLASQTSRDWHHSQCFGCGESNYASLRAHFPFDEQFGEVRFSYTSRPEHEGAPGFVHGGILATLMDEAQGVLCFHLGHFVMTDRLTMHYQKASELIQPLLIRAWITTGRRKRLYTRATIHSPLGDLLVSSTARWYVMNERVIRKIFGKNLKSKSTDHLIAVLEANRRRAKKIRQRLNKQQN